MLAANPILLAAIFDDQFVRWVVWVGLVLLTVTLLLLVRTRWGQSQPLGKCVALSLGAHLLLAIYISTVNIVTSSVGAPEGQGIQVALVDSSAAALADDDRASESQPAQPWDAFGPGAPDAGLPTGDLASEAPVAPLPQLAEPERAQPSEISAAPDKTPPVTIEAPPPAITETELTPVSRPKQDAAPIEVPAEPEADPVPPPEPVEPAPAKAASAPSAVEGSKPLVPVMPPKGDALSGPGPAGTAGKRMPEEFKLRTGNHAQVAKGLGATQESEAAVNGALRWLAVNQGPSGRWEARRTGAGSGKAADGQDRFGAGTTADTGITGLALLAFLASGNTHLRGEHQVTVRRGLEFLLSMQESDGNLGASHNMYERMYCHAMATCALSEAYAMTGDDRLKAAVSRAIAFTVASQDKPSGGWRYGPNQPGDTSQLGWQVMALKSAHLAGIPIQDQTRGGIERFLKSVTLGNRAGLACYQPVRQVPSRSMTAEALVCRQFLGIPDSPEALSEASTFVLQEVPGMGTTNFYYWYYATLSMYQLQGEPWRLWNEALQKKLLSSQRTEGEFKGSWDPDPVWGGCGGRGYSTALGALCLEVYYRFLPLYVEAAGRERRTK